MLTEATASAELRVVEGSACSGAGSLGELDPIYLGERGGAHPAMLVIAEDSPERTFAPGLGGFDWGWPNICATRRLARAPLLDVTGRGPPAGRRDAPATEELAHFPWMAFSLTRRESPAGSSPAAARSLTRPPRTRRQRWRVCQRRPRTRRIHSPTGR